MRSTRCRGRNWRLVVVVAALVVPPTMIATAAVPFMTFASAVSSILLPPIWAFAPPASTLSPEASARPEGGQKQQNREFSHLKPYLSIRTSSRVGGQTVADLASLVHVRCQQADRRTNWRRGDKT